MKIYLFYEKYRFFDTQIIEIHLNDHVNMPFNNNKIMIRAFAYAKTMVTNEKYSRFNNYNHIVYTIKVDHLAQSYQQNKPSQQQS
jgi:hypothetical protein